MKIRMNDVISLSKSAFTLIGKTAPVVCGMLCFLIAFFALLLIAASVVLMIPSFTGSFANGYIMQPSVVVLFLYAFLIALVWLLFEYWHRTWPGIFTNIEVVVLMVACFLSSLFFIKILPFYCEKGAMAWDSLMVLKSVNSGKICFFHPLRNQYWCNYEIFCSMLAAVFNTDIVACRIAQAIACASAIFPVYRLSERIANRRVARFVALTMGMSPTLQMYALLPTGEFLAASLLIFSTYFLMKGLVYEKSTVLKCINFVFSGVFWGMSDLFKSLSPIIALALCISIFIFSGVRGKEYYKRGIAAILIVFAVFYTMRREGQAILAGLSSTPRLCTKHESIGSTLLYELALGLNVRKEGFWDLKLAKEYLKLPEDKKVEFVKNAMRRDWKKYPVLMLKKFRNIHGSPCYHHGAVRQFISMFRNKHDKYTHPAWVISVADIGTVFFRIMFFLGAVGMFITRRRSISCLLPGLFAAVIVLVFACIEQLIEGHGRYKTAIYPFYFLILPYIYVWFKKDNPVYRKVGGLVQRVKERLSKHER